MSLSNELRVRSNTLTNPGLVPGRHSQQQYLLRAFFGADFHVGEHFRLYTELAHGSLDGRNEGTKSPCKTPRPRMNTGFAALQQGRRSHNWSISI